MTQFARPSSDVASTGWTPTPLWQQLDEEPASDVDFIQSDSVGNGNSTLTCEIKLSSVIDPHLSTGHVMRARWRDSGAQFGDTEQGVQLDLFCGATRIATMTLGANGFFADATQTLSAAEADAITDYSDLRIQVTYFSQLTESLLTEGMVSWFRLDVPDAPAKPVTLSPIYKVLLYLGDLVKSNVLLLDPAQASDPSAGETHSGSAVGATGLSAVTLTLKATTTASSLSTLGLAAAETGKKAITTASAIGQVGLAASEVGKKAGAGTIVSAVGLKAQDAGAEGIAYGAVGAVGMSGVEAGTRGATTSASVGRVGASGSEQATRSATGSSIGAVGPKSSASGSAVSVIQGSAIGRLGSASIVVSSPGHLATTAGRLGASSTETTSASRAGTSAGSAGTAGQTLGGKAGSAVGFVGASVTVTGFAGEARLFTEETTGGWIHRNLYIPAKRFIQKIVSKITLAPVVLGRHIGGSVGLSGSTSGERYIIPVHRSLDFTQASGFARGSHSITVYARGVRVDETVVVPSAEPALEGPVVVAPGVLPPPLPRPLGARPVIAFAGSAEGSALSVLGGASGQGHWEPPEAELVFIFDQLLAA